MFIKSIVITSNFIDKLCLVFMAVELQPTTLNLEKFSEHVLLNTIFNC